MNKIGRIAVVGVVVLGAMIAQPSVGFGQAEVATMDMATVGTARQQKWLAATIGERMRLAETLGDEGARKMAKAKGYVVVFDGTERTLPQGPDQVYRTADGRVIVYEAKGGSGQLGHAYGHAQGTSEWAVESAKRVLRSPNAGKAEQAASREILEAAARGQVEVHVIRTGHVLGEPSVAMLEAATKTTTDASGLARLALDDLAQRNSRVVDDVVRSTDDVARATAEGGSLLRTVSKAAVPVAVAIDAGFRVQQGIETERQFATGEITAEQREVAHAKNAAGIAGGWAGAWVGAELGVMGGGAAGSVIAPGPGTVVGGAVGGAAGGIAGYFGGEAAAGAAAEWTIRQVHAAGTTIADSVDGAWNGTIDTAKSAANGISHAWNWAFAE